MNAPDKIYLEKDKESQKIHHLWGDKPVVSSAYEHIEYVRKEALLEWLGEMYAGTRSYFKQFLLTDLIDIIKSL